MVFASPRHCTPRAEKHTSSGMRGKGSDLRNPHPGGENEADLWRRRPEGRKDHVARRQRRSRTTGASARKMNVNLVAVESNEVKLAAVGLDERRDDLAADLLDLLLGTLVHGENACEKRGRNGGQGRGGGRRGQTPTAGRPDGRTRETMQIKRGR